MCLTNYPIKETQNTTFNVHQYNILLEWKVVRIHYKDNNIRYMFVNNCALSMKNKLMILSHYHGHD